MLTLAFIGNGKSTNRYHLPYVLTRKDTLCVKTIYNHQIKSFKWDKIEGVHYTDNLDDVLNDPEIDAVIVCTRHDLHYEYAMKVLASKKHCMVEKPFMETLEQAKEAFEYAHQQGVILQAYQNRRFDSDFLTVQKVIESGVLGDVYELAMHFDYYRPEIPESVQSFEPSGSILYGHGSHTIDQVLSYFGDPQTIHYDVKQLLGPGRMSDYFDLDLNYKNLKVSVRSSYYRAKQRPSFEVYGTQGTFIKETKDRQEEHLKLFYMPGESGFGVDDVQHYGTLTYYDENGIYHEEKVISEVGDYACVYDDFRDAILLNKPQTITPHQTLLQMKILEEGMKRIQ